MKRKSMKSDKESIAESLPQAIRIAFITPRVEASSGMSGRESLFRSSTRKSTEISVNRKKIADMSEPTHKTQGATIVLWSQLRHP